MLATGIQKALDELRNPPNKAAADWLELARFRNVEVELENGFVPVGKVVPTFRRLDEALDFAWYHVTEQIAHTHTDHPITPEHWMELQGDDVLLWHVIAPLTTVVKFRTIRRT